MDSPSRRSLSRPFCLFGFYSEDNQTNIMSRYPQMSRNPITYDRSLLVGAPAITREDRQVRGSARTRQNTQTIRSGQAGYDISALEQGSYPQQNNNNMPAPIGRPSLPPLPAADPFQDPYNNRDVSPSPAPSSSKGPWWKRRRWAALALIIFIGILCGIVAGVVTQKNNSRTTALVTDSPQGAVLGSSTSPSGSTTQPTNNLGGTFQPSTQTIANPPVNTVGGSTVYFGPSTPAGIISPTATAPSINPDSGNGEIPHSCYLIPTSPSCAPYFQIPPRL